MTGRPWQVRWYYDVWTQLPVVQRRLWGRGVIAVNEAGHRRLGAMPLLQADDLAASLTFEPHEVVLVPGARVVILPLTFADLLRRRARCVTGVAQVERAQDLDGSADRTRISDLAAVIRHRPGMLLRVGYFLSVTVFAMLRASRALARGDYVSWLRDESSRTAAATAAPRRRCRPETAAPSPWPPCPASWTAGTGPRTTGNPPVWAAPIGWPGPAGEPAS